MVLWAVGAMEGFNQEQHHQLHVRLERKVIMPLLTSPSHSLGAELGSPGHLCLILGSGGGFSPLPTMCQRQRHGAPRQEDVFVREPAGATGVLIMQNH